MTGRSDVRHPTHFLRSEVVPTTMEIPTKGMSHRETLS